MATLGHPGAGWLALGHQPMARQAGRVNVEAGVRGADGKLCPGRIAAGVAAHEQLLGLLKQSGAAQPLGAMSDAG